MRRASAAIIGTLAGTALLVGAKLGTPSASTDPDLTAGNVAGGGAGDPSAGPAASAISGQPAASGQPTASGQPGQPAPAASGATPAPATPGATKTTAPAAAPGLKSGTFTGSGVSERYGTITVTITTSGGKITNLSATCGGCNSTSQSISSNAFTKLRSEALSAQSASVATVSGATYTSGAYKTSLQAAINAAKA